MGKNKFITWERLRNIFLYVGLVILVIATVFILFGLYFNIANFITSGKWLVFVSLALISLGIAFHSIIISYQSDEKMKAIARADFLTVVSVFENERIVLIEKLNKALKEKLPKATTKKDKATILEEIVFNLNVAIWKCVTHLERAKVLKKYVEKSDQDTLVNYFGILVDILPWGNNIILNREVNNIVSMYSSIWKDFDVSDGW